MSEERCAKIQEALSQAGGSRFKGEYKLKGFAIKSDSFYDIIREVRAAMPEGQKE